MLSLDEDHWLIRYIMDSVIAASQSIARIRDADSFGKSLEESEHMELPKIDEMDLGTGNIRVRMEPKSGLFYKILGEECG